jgi:hypothetical protein
LSEREFARTCTRARHQACRRLVLVQAEHRQRRDDEYCDARGPGPGRRVDVVIEETGTDPPAPAF